MRNLDTFIEHNNMEHRLSETAENVLKIAEEASAILIKYFRTSIDVEHKENEFDFVTIADKESDKLIRESIQKFFPNDSILSEESSIRPDNYDGRVWMVDPLDGTRSYVSGSDSFAIHIALAENGILLLGVVVMPAQNKIYIAEKGKGAFQKIGDEYCQIHTTSINEISKARLVVRSSTGDVRLIEDKIANMNFVERIPSGGMGTKICLVAEGNAEAEINTHYKASKWDSAAPQIILEEAGGIITNIDGNPIDYKKENNTLSRSVVASANKELHQKIIEQLSKMDL